MKPDSQSPKILGYEVVLAEVAELIQKARADAAARMHTAMTTLYWLVGKRIVQFEQKGKHRADYGQQLLKRLSHDLTKTFGKGFSIRNLRHMRGFYLGWRLEAPTDQNELSVADQMDYEIRQTRLPNSNSSIPCPQFPLPWSAYVVLMGIQKREAREFYETEAIRGGWSIRQLTRQVNSQFFERTALSKNKEEMLQSTLNQGRKKCDSHDIGIRDPFVLEFLGLKDEYSESELEEALVNNLETFLLELGNGYCFIGRQKKLRIGDSWFRVDLIFFHRILRCLIIVDLKVGGFSHADAGQMHMYLNYARQHWTHESENPPVGLMIKQHLFCKKQQTHQMPSMSR